MLCVATELRSSPIQGVGVFATEEIGENEVVWFFHAMVDRVFVEDFPQRLNRAQRFWFETHATFERGFWLLDGDNAKYLNHSASPNLRCQGDGALVAVRPIAAGEELTCDYREFCERCRQDPLYGGQ